MRVILSILPLLFISHLQAQLFVSPGGMMEIGKGTIVTVKNMDAENQGNISHAGDMEVTGNIINSGRWVCDSGFKNRITLSLNWTNNSIFKPGIGRVEFNGANQNLSGNNETFFYNLMFRGVTGNRKTMLTNVSCRDSLYLQNIELATNGNRFSLNNSLIPVQRNTGFISTNNDGFVRLFFPSSLVGNREIPLGFGTTVSQYKPLYTINTQRDSFDVRLFGYSPSKNERNSNSLQDSLCSINEAYYFGIQTYGTKIFYGIKRNSSEQEYTKLARWNSKTWEKLSGSAPTPLIATQNLAYNAQQPLTNEYISQTRERPFVDAGEDIELTLGAKIVLKPTGYFPAGSSFLWSPGTDLSCPQCPNPIVSPIAYPGIYTIRVSNGPNCMAIDSLEIKQNGVYAELIPNAFSPNDDGINDKFGPIIYPGDKLISMEIFNRWGEKLYSGTENWDGSYQGSVVDQGVYTYIIYILRPGKRYFNISGTLTILK